jgi:hypothetical protein
LAVSPRLTEEKIAVVVNPVSGSNHAIHIEWPVQLIFGYINFDFDAVDLQGAPSKRCAQVMARCAVCKVHRTQCGCSKDKCAC